MFLSLAVTQAGCRRLFPCRLLHRLATHAILAATAVFAQAQFYQAGYADESAPPNIIIILADDLGYSDLGCYGGEISTPNIDALATGGVRFTQVYNSARCCPSRASLMTGLYPSQAGIGDFTTPNPSPNRGPGYLGRLNDQCVTLAEVLKPAGYGCYYVGKWHMHEKTGPIKRGFDEFYGFTRGHSHDQYDADYYIRLPQGRPKEIDPPADEFYATDTFNDYALEFIRQGQSIGKPWFLFLGHSSPHFPVQAPAERADKYDQTYLRGWDVLREERYARMQKLGLIDGEQWTLTPRSIVPVDEDDIANGYSGQPNPAWDSLDEPRQRDLARRMAVFAAMVERVDLGVGRIVDHLKSTGDLDNTLILFLSDNGACYEWGPFGFDGPSRKGITTLRTGNELREIGGRGTHQAYGSAWANLGNTPFRLYKHFTHEGGISMPFIAHWPRGIGRPNRWVREPGHVMDVLPTLLEASGAKYPQRFHGHDILPPEGTSLLSAMRGQSLPRRTIGFDHQGARALRDGDWKIVWSKRMPHEITWELYNLAEDRCETNDLAAQHPDRVQKMVAAWEQWANHVDVVDEPENKQTQSSGNPPSPQIAHRSLAITARVLANKPRGVVLAQGGNQHGYALHFVDGKAVFDVRVHGQVTRLIAETHASGTITLRATLDARRMTLAVDDREPISLPSPGLIPVQPVDELSVGFDEKTSAGDYTAPNRFVGKVLDYSITELDLSAATDDSLSQSRRSPRPNFIFLLTDDVSPDDLSVYGNDSITTPNLERLASRGLVFDNAYLTISSCSPSRCSIITGRYPHNTGAPELHTPLPSDQTTFVQKLREAGYHTVISGKNHMAQPEQLGFAESSDSKPAGSEKWVAHLRDRPQDEPFFCWFASHDAHHPFTPTDNVPLYDPDDVEVPPMMFDGPGTRSELAGYYHEVSRTDHAVGELMQELERQGIADNTYLVYCSDNGRPFPRCKTYLYESGIKTPLIVAGPDVVSGRTPSLVSSIDFAATFLELAGIACPDTVQGVSIVPILRDPTAVVRDVAFAERNWHVYQTHERAVRTGDWLYVWNAWPDRHNVSGESSAFRFAAARELWAAADAGKLTQAQALLTQLPQPPELLFDVRHDPHQFDNLSTNAQYVDTLIEMRRLLDQWKTATGDSVPTNPTPDRQPLHEGVERSVQRGEFPGAIHDASRINRPGPIRTTHYQSTSKSP